MNKQTKIERKNEDDDLTAPLGDMEVTGDLFWGYLFNLEPNFMKGNIQSLRL